MKKFISTILIVAIALTVAVPVMDASSTNSSMNEEQLSLIIGGQQLNADKTPGAGGGGGWGYWLPCVAGIIGGGLLGGLTGAAAGSIIPGLGTGWGAAIGAVGGALSGGAANC